MIKPEEIYWNIGKTLTHNRLFNFIIGNRGGGKSYGAKKYVIDKFIKKGEQFGIIRRYEKELIKSLPEFFNDIADSYPDYEFKADTKRLYIRPRPEDPEEPWTKADIAGHGFFLSTADNLKSIPYPKITTLIFEEFLLKKGKQQYLDDEPTTMLNLYETIARPMPEELETAHPRVIMFLIGNATTITNPYFLYFDLQMPTKQDKNGKYIWKHPTRPILVEDVRNAEFIKLKQKTEFGALIAGTKYAQFSIENKFLQDDDKFIEPRHPDARYYFTITYQNTTLGAWINMKEGKIYMTSATDPTYPIKYAVTMRDHSPNMLFLKNRQRAGHFRNFLEAYQLGAVRFENINIKNICYEIIRLASNSR